MTSLTYQSYVVGDLRIDGTRIYGQNGPEFPEVTINAELNLSPYEDSGEPLGGRSENRKQYPYTVTNLSGNLRLKTDRSSRGKTVSLCHLQSDFDPKHIDERWDYRTKLVGRLTPHHVNELEKHRQSNDLHLQVSCMLTLYFEQPPSKAERFGQVQNDIDVTIPRSHWTDNVYPALGGREIFVIEIPKGPQSIERAWAKVEDAKQAFSNWSTEGTMIACREAADVLKEAMKEHYGEESCVYKERWYRAFEGLKAQASLGGHFEQIRGNANCERPEELQITRADLECLITRTQAMLKYTEALLREKKK